MRLDDTRLAMTCGRKLQIASALSLLASVMAKAEEVPIDIAALTSTVLTQTNAYRKPGGAPELRPSAALDTAAASYAMYLAEHEGTGHTADGRTPAKRAYAQGYQWCYVAENVWGGWRKPDPMMVDEVSRQAMEGWKKSPGHNANLLDKRTRDIGIGAAAWRQGDGRVVFRVVQVFGEECPGKPRPAPTLGEMLDNLKAALR
jgi:uncharacterized protein YkwD